MSIPARSMRVVALSLLVTAGCKSKSAEYYCASPTATLCTAKEERPCYDGPAGTEGTGVCQAGTQTCNKTGTAWSACQDAVLPAPNDCVAPTTFSCDTASACGSISARESPFGFIKGSLVSADAQGDLALVTTRHNGSFNSYAVEKRSPTGSQVWQIKVSPNQTDCVYIVGVVHAPDDDVIVYGGYGVPGRACPLDLGTGPLPTTDQSAFVARYAASDGTPRWVRTYPWQVNGLAVDASGAIVIGGSYVHADSLGSLTLPEPTRPSDAYLARLDAAGEPLWAKTFDGPVGGINRVAVDGAGAIYTTSLREEGEQSDACTARLNLVLSAFEVDGTPRFEKVFGGNYGNDADIALDATGRLALGASFGLGADDLPSPGDGGSLDGNAFVAVLGAAQGDVEWVRNLYGWHPGTVLFDAHGNVILAGVHRERVTVARYAPDGTPFSLVASADETTDAIQAARSGDRVWISASFPGKSVSGWIGSLLHADP